ncbi:MAG: DNA topoisomerase IV subunit B, partial [Isosphaeraceae bacterium]|nr:DNA topoisomerase IV subunit B [Isosphaeraceae bacterium]
MATGTYNADSITVLEGLEAVRRRPGMYIGGVDKAGLHHLLWEIVDNAVDEVMNGHASRIIVNLESDGKTISVSDNGRGIPVDIHPKTGKSALEVIFTTLHAGGKFDNDAYKVAGGLHGVGASVVNALSKSLVAQVRRDGMTYTQKYRRGKPLGSVEPGEPAPRGSGTTVTFTPDPEIFHDATYDPALIAERLEVKTYLNKGLVIQFNDQKAKTSVEFRHDGGVADFLDALNQGRQDTRVAPLPFVLEREDLDDGLRCHLALSWTEATDEDIRSFVNTIPTRDGGTHEQGMRDAVKAAVLRFMSAHDLVKKGMEIKGEDIREGLTAVLSVCVHEPQFQGQTKGRLNNPEVKALVESMVRPSLENFLLKNKSVGDAIAARVIQAARAREASRAAASQVRRKTAISGRLNLPGKLHDCDSNNPDESELFIVEGDSAGGSAKQGRDRDVQAILPLKGKVLNAEQAGKAKVLDNKELTDIISALGCGMDDQFDSGRLRYGKVILLTDADSDGHHIATLLLTFFYRHVPALFEEGRIFLACPPLYKVVWGKETHWAADDASRDRILSKLPKNAKPNITRFKGLGEMPAQLLFETTLDPARRRLL